MKSVALAAVNLSNFAKENKLTSAADDPLITLISKLSKPQILISLTFSRARFAQEITDHRRRICFQGESLSHQMFFKTSSWSWTSYSTISPLQKTQHEACCVALCSTSSLILHRLGTSIMPSQMDCRWHARCLTIFKISYPLDHGGVRSWQEQTFLVPWMTPRRCQIGLAVLHDADIMYSKWVVRIEMACEVQSVLSMEPSDSSPITAGPGDTEAA